MNVCDLEIFNQYKGKGLSYQLLDVATNELCVKNLAVNKQNHIAKRVYEKYGFKLIDENEDLYYMSIDK